MRLSLRRLNKDSRHERPDQSVLDQVKGFAVSGIRHCFVTAPPLGSANDQSGRPLALAIWCFCRFYYFAFYVIEHYVDPAYRFSGLWSFVCWLGERRKKS